MATQPPTAHHQEHNVLGQPIGRPVDGWTAADRPARTVLEGRYGRLEPLDVERHGDALWQAVSQERDGGSWSYLPYGPFANREEYLAHLDAHASTTDPLFFATVDGPSGQAVGVGALQRIVPEQGCIEIGHLYFSPCLQRTRLATESLFLMMDYAVSTLGNRRLEWKCNDLNEASKQAARRLGFSYEGLFRNAGVVKGRNRDTAWFSIVDEEWPALARAFRRWLEPSNFEEGGQQRRSLGQLREESSQG